MSMTPSIALLLVVFTMVALGPVQRAHAQADSPGAEVQPDGRAPIEGPLFNCHTADGCGVRVSNYDETSHTLLVSGFGLTFVYHHGTWISFQNPVDVLFFGYLHAIGEGRFLGVARRRGSPGYQVWEFAESNGGWAPVRVAGRDLVTVRSTIYTAYGPAPQTTSVAAPRERLRWVRRMDGIWERGDPSPLGPREHPLYPHFAEVVMTEYRTQIGMPPCVTYMYWSHRVGSTPMLGGVCRRGELIVYAPEVGWSTLPQFHPRPRRSDATPIPLASGTILYQSVEEASLNFVTANGSWKKCGAFSDLVRNAHEIDAYLYMASYSGVYRVSIDEMRRHAVDRDVGGSH